MDAEFWRREAAREAAEMRQAAVRWALAFVALALMVFGVIWWATQSLHFSASRVEATTQATYRVYGLVRDAASKEPVAFAHVQDDPHARPPLHRTMADHLGHFELYTLAEPHRVVVSALGYKPASQPVGRKWYIWTPAGAERIEFFLERE